MPKHITGCRSMRKEILKVGNCRTHFKGQRFVLNQGEIANNWTWNKDGTIHPT